MATPIGPNELGILVILIGLLACWRCIVGHRGSHGAIADDSRSRKFLGPWRHALQD